jgi:hypothetical protein
MIFYCKTFILLDFCFYHAHMNSPHENVLHKEKYLS